MRGLEHGSQLGIVHVVESPPRREARLPERLGLPEVPDPRHEPLVEQSVADLARLRPRPEAREHRLEVGGLAEDVGAETRRSAAADELEDGAVPEHGLVLGAPQHEPRLPHSRHASPLDAPATLHAQMAAQDKAALEVEQEVLPHCLHPLEPPAVEPLGEALHRGARMRRLDLDALADENLQPPGGAM